MRLLFKEHGNIELRLVGERLSGIALVFTDPFKNKNQLTLTPLRARMLASALRRLAHSIDGLGARGQAVPIQSPERRAKQAAAARKRNEKRRQARKVNAKTAPGPMESGFLGDDV